MHTHYTLWVHIKPVEWILQTHAMTTTIDITLAGGMCMYDVMHLGKEQMIHSQRKDGNTDGGKADSLRDQSGTMQVTNTHIQSPITLLVDNNNSLSLSLSLFKCTCVYASCM